ncbi:anti-sigma factor family protein [Streptosporangium sp. NPDC050855]|uniref:anti-sigma factor family protein n=1 Tax=Streptosporangium sp. NPDC050855 TaxID=3366194 RepID=UPI0037A3023C
MTTTCDEVRMSLGVYALGALEPDERAPVETHLAGCARCRAELEELTGVATFLGKVSQDDVAQVASPPGAVLDRLLSAGVRRRRTNRLMLSLAASVLVVGLGGGTLWTVSQSQQDVGTAVSAPHPAAGGETEADQGADARSGGREQGETLRDPGSSQDDARTKAAPSSPSSPSSPPSPSSRRPLPSSSPSSTGSRPSDPESQIMLAPSEVRAADRNGAVRAVATASVARGVTTVRVVLTGVADGTRCRLRVFGDGGLRQTAGVWTVGGAAQDASGAFVTTTTIPPERITSFEIATAGGRVLITLLVP